MKKHFNKNLIISEEEKQFQLFNTCWICEKLIEIIVTYLKKFRAAAHWSCNKNVQLTKKVPVIFHNWRGYDSHLIFYELKKFDVKINVIPNRLEKYTAFILNKNLVFIKCVQFMNSSPEKIGQKLVRQ